MDIDGLAELLFYFFHSLGRNEGAGDQIYRFSFLFHLSGLSNCRFSQLQSNKSYTILNLLPEQCYFLNEEKHYISESYRCQLTQKNLVQTILNTKKLGAEILFQNREFTTCCHFFEILNQQGYRLKDSQMYSVL